MTTTMLLALLVAIIGRFMSDEVKAWFGWLHRCIRGIAVARLPESKRLRYSEEWESGLEEIPGEIFKLFYSLGLLRAAEGISQDALPRLLDSNRPLPFPKRLFDITFSFVMLIVCAPWLLLLVIAIKLESSGPAMYATVRVGRGGRVFPFWRLRTFPISKSSPRLTSRMRAFTCTMDSTGTRSRSTLKTIWKVAACVERLQ